MVATDKLNDVLAEVPDELHSRFREIAVIVDRFCDERLDDDYKEVCRRLLARYCQEGTGIERGKAEGWAAGVVYSAGRINFLTDPSHDPCVASEDVAKGCGVSVATMHNKAKAIRDALALSRLDLEFVVPNLLAQHPLVEVFELSKNPSDIVRQLPDELREQAKQAGLLRPDDAQPTVRDRSSRKSLGRHASVTGTFYTLKIVLNHIQPPIWRRVRVPDVTLEEVHDVIQATMGWDNSHLYEFCVGADRYQPPPPADTPAFGWYEGDDTLSTYEFLLSDVVRPRTSKKRFQFKYLYDFGDSWEHTITVEKIETDAEGSPLPVCLDGQRACPPDDCGGVWGYDRLLEVLGDRRHPEHAELKEWIGGRFDPEKFSVAKVNARFKHRTVAD